MSLLKLITFRQQPTGGYVVTDPDAQAFVATAMITNDTQKQAVDNLTISLKNNNLWSKMTAIYPFVGGNSLSHSYNLKNTSQYQITWNGTVTHDQNGFQGDGTTGYGNTNLNSASVGPAQRVHGSVYCRTPFVPSSTGFTAYGSVAVQGGFFNGFTLSIKANDNNTYFGNHDSITAGPANIVSDTTGFFVSTSNPNTNRWFPICWSPELNLFCTVAVSGINNRVMTSPDGITWTIRTSAADNSWSSICWSAETGLFVTVANTGIGNRVMTSPDGINWTVRNTTGLDDGWFSICWSKELGLFCAVATSGTGGRIMTSPDGINWTGRTAPASNNWSSICWSAETGLFVAVASTGIGNRVMTSPDGISWTLRNTTGLDNNWFSICWSKELGLFAAGATTGIGNRVMTSPDGINWTSRTSAADSSWINMVWSPTANGTGLFVAVSNSSTNNIMTSPDGINWTVRSYTSTNIINARGVSWSPQLNLFVTTQYTISTTTNSNAYLTSPDGINWTVRYFQLDMPQSLSLSNSKRVYKNNLLLRSNANGSTINGVSAAGPVYIGARHLLDNTGNYYPIGTELPELFSIAQYSFMSFGLQLSSGEAFILNNIVQAFQTTLGRQV